MSFQRNSTTMAAKMESGCEKLWFLYLVVWHRLEPPRKIAKIEENLGIGIYTYKLSYKGKESFF